MFIVLVHQWLSFDTTVLYYIIRLFQFTTQADMMRNKPNKYQFKRKFFCMFCQRSLKYGDDLKELYITQFETIGYQRNTFGYRLQRSLQKNGSQQLLIMNSDHSELLTNRNMLRENQTNEIQEVLHRNTLDYKVISLDDSNNGPDNLRYYFFVIHRQPQTNNARKYCSQCSRQYPFKNIYLTIEYQLINTKFKTSSIIYREKMEIKDFILNLQNQTEDRGEQMKFQQKFSIRFRQDLQMVDNTHNKYILKSQQQVQFAKDFFNNKFSISIKNDPS